MFKPFEEKIALAVEKVKQLKDERNALAQKVAELERAIAAKDQEVTKLITDKATIKKQLEDLLEELEALEIK